MSYTKQTVTVTGNEKVFIKTFIEQLKQADSRITCDTDIDAQFSSNAKTPSFTVNFAPNSRMVFTRAYDLNSTSNTYYLKLIINSIETTVNLCFFASEEVWTKVITRTFRFAVAANENVIYIALGGHNITVPTSAQLSVMSISDGEFSATGFSKSANPLGSEFYCTDSINQNIVVKFTDRLNYESDSGIVEIIKNKALLDSSKTTKIRAFSGLYDSSTVTAFSFLRIDNDSYYAISNHALIKINQGDE